MKFALSNGAVSVIEAPNDSVGLDITEIARARRHEADWGYVQERFDRIRTNIRCARAEWKPGVYGGVETTLAGLARATRYLEEAKAEFLLLEDYCAGIDARR